MKTHTWIGLGFLLVVGVAALSQFGSTLEVISDTSSTTVERVVEEVHEEEKDVVEEAQRELERINNELDQEETRLLEEKAQIEERLEQIRETRVSFQ